MGSSFYGGNKNSFYGGSGFYGGGDFEPELTVIDKVPYVFRKTGGDINVKKKTKQETIIGGTVAWNQLLNADSNFSATSGATITSTVDHVATFTATAEGQQAYKTFRAKPGHIYFGMMTYKTSVATTEVVGRFNRDIPGKATTEWQNVFNIYLHPQNYVEAARSVGVKDLRTSGWDAIQVKEFQAFDLTQMFGATIADYIYSLEQTNVGAGVAWFKKLFPKGYYAYDAGTLRSVQTSTHKTVEFNAYDNATGTAQLLGGMEYQITGAYTTLSYSTGEMITPDANGNFTPGTNGALTVTGGDATTTCVHLVQDGKRDGKFEAYVEHSYPLDDSLTLRGVPTLDANNKLRYDGDIYASDGTVTRRYASVDMGTLTWKNNSTDSVYAHVSDRKSGSQLGVCTGFTQVPANTGIANMVYGEYKLYGTSDSVAVKVEGITFSNASEKLSGIYLIYELDTPTTESADPYTNPQIIDPYGTEEFVDAGVEAGTRDVAIPVGHETTYKVKGN